jgi:radical SAM superfamily enzyme YgiQ (UPF0313 family)
MTKRVLLINPQRAAGEPITFPLGLAYVAAVLRQERFAVDVLDLNVTSSDIRVELVVKLAEQAYSFFGITGMIINFKEAQKISAVLKCQCPQVPIILGGGLASAIPRAVFSKTDVDICVLGEGEVTIVDLLTALSRGEDISHIQGICFKHSNGVTFNQLRKVAAPINELPFPAWDLFPIAAYLGAGKKGGRHMDIVTSRGCPYRCTFCYKGIFGDKFRGRDAENIIQEILLLKNRYGIKSFTIRDDTFVIERKRVVEFCGKLLDARVRLEWFCNGRIDRMDKELLKLMKKAGCVSIAYGIESGNSEILSKMKKDLSIEKAKDVIRATRKEGMTSLGYFIIGMPGENRETINDSIRFCKETGIVPHFNFAGPIPGTELYDYAVRSGYIKNDLDYVLNMDWKSLSVNMTNLSNEELLFLGKKASADVMVHNILLYPMQSLRLLRSTQKEFGRSEFLLKLIRWLLRSLQSTLSSYREKTKMIPDNRPISVIHFLDSEWESDHRRGNIEAYARECKTICIEPPLNILFPFIKPKVFLKWLMGTRRKALPNSNIYFYRPLMLVPYSLAFRCVFFGHLNNLFLRVSFRKLRNYLNDYKRISVITCPQESCVINSLEEDALIYDCYDAYSKHPENSEYFQKIIEKAEIAMLKKCNIVFTTSKTLYREKKEKNPATHYIPNSADVDLFREAIESDIPVPNEFDNIPMPRIGLIGNIYELVDIDLLDYLAVKHPEWSIVLIGGIRGSLRFRKSDKLKELLNRANVYFLGFKAYTDLPKYQKGIDICLLPYKINEYSTYVHPSKTYQYLSQKKPIISTDLAEIAHLKNVIRIAKSPEEFENNIIEALEYKYKYGNNDELLKIALDNSTQVSAKKKISIIESYIKARSLIVKVEM